MATNNKVKNVVLGVAAVTTVVAGAYLVKNNLFYEERDYSDVLVESAKKYVENNKIAIDSKLVTSAQRLKETDNLVSKINDECVSNSYVTITNEDGSYKYEPSLSCEPVDAGTSNETVSDALSYEVLLSSTKLTNGNVEVRVIFNEEVQDVNVQGWTLSSDKRNLTKIYTANGDEQFEVRSLAGDKRAIVRVSASNIDKDAPVILVNGKNVVSTYGTSVNLNVEDDNLSSVLVNGKEQNNVSLTQAGQYEIVATDKAGNKSTASFSLGRVATSAPVINKIVDGGVYSAMPLVITFSDGEGLLDGEIEFKSADSVKTPGDHTLTVTNEVGSTTVNFTIDPTEPEVWAETEDGVRISDGKATNKNVRIHFRDDYSKVTAKSNTLYRDLEDGEIFTQEGTYVITVNDEAGHTATLSFTINRNVPTVEGVEDNKYYKDDRTITFDDKGGTVTATLDGTKITSGTTVSQEKTYDLVVSDDAGNSAEISFTIDKTAPVFTGIDANITTKDNITVNVLDDNLASITVDGVKVENGEKVLNTEGKYTLVATDKAGLSTTRIVTIDKGAPIVKLNGSTKYQELYENEVNISVEDFTATTIKLNGEVFTGTKVSQGGKYVLEVEDEVGHITTVRFTIYKEIPEVTLISGDTEVVVDDDSVVHYFNQDVTVKIAENVLKINATLNGESLTDAEIANGKTIAAVNRKHNEYTLVVTDELGRSATINFVIDKKSPTSSVMSHTYNTDMLVHFDDESGIEKAILDGVEIENDTVTLSEERGYRLQLIDKAGNSIVYYPTIDKSAAELTFESNGSEVTVEDLTKTLYFNKAVKVSYTDATFVKVVLNDEELVEASDRIKTGNVTLEEDGEYVLTITDSGSNEVTVKVVIDSVDPKASVRYENIDDENTDRTVDSVKMILTVDEDITWSDSNSFDWMKLNDKTEDGKDQYVYIVDTTTTGFITITDLAGNSIDVPYTVTIDKENPKGSLVLSTEETTNKDIVMTLVVDELVDIEDTNDLIWVKLDALTSDGMYQYITTVEQNIDGIVTFYDSNRNNVSISYNITNIDKKVEVSEATYSENAKLEATNQDVTITLTANEKLIFTDEKLTWSEKKNADGIYTYTAIAEENVSNTLNITDEIGNPKSVSYAVTNIDKDAPVVEGLEDGKYLEETKTYLFNKTVMPTFNEGTAVLTRDFIDENGNPAQEVTDNFKSGAKITKDGVYTLVVTDAATNSTTINIIVDRTKPTAEITADVPSTQFTKGPVILTVKTSEPVTMITESTALTQVDDQTWTFRKGINGTITFKFQDEAGNVGSAKYTVENIDKTKPTIEGVENGGIYNENKTVTFEDENPGVSATLNGEEFLGGEVGHGVHTLIVTDAAGNKVTYKFTVDTVFPVITGVENNGLYNKNVKPSFNEGTAVLTKKGVLEDGTIGDVTVEYNKGDVLTEDGIYTLTVTDAAGNSTPVTFTIDKTAPTAIVTPDVPADKYTNGVVMLTVETSEPVTMLTSNAALTQIDDQTWTFKKGINGTITFKFKDAAGNIGTIAYTVENIDKTKPVITGIENKGIYNEPVQIYYTDDHGVNGFLNDEFMTSGETVSEDGKYSLVVTDEANNTVNYTFTIDMTAPEITGVEDNGLYNKNVRPSYNEGTGVLSKKVVDEAGNESYVKVEDYKKGQSITEDGEYTLVVTDGADNSTTVTFTIDKTKPTAEITPSTTNPTKDPVILTIKTSEPVTMITENKALTQIDNQTWTFKKSINGTITFKFSDAAGNVGSAKITVENIDKDAPTITLSDEGTKVKDGVYTGAVTVTVDDANPGDVYVNGVLDEKFGTSKTFEETGEYTIRTVDKAGNESSIETFKIYGENPKFDEFENKLVTVPNKTIEVLAPTAKDVFGDEAEVTVDSIKFENETVEEINFANSGTYTITYIATDESLRTATATLTVIVLDVSEFEAIQDVMSILDKASESGSVYDRESANKDDYTLESWNKRTAAIKELATILAGDKIPATVDQTYVDFVVARLNSTAEDSDLRLISNGVSTVEYDKQVARFNALEDTKDDYDKNAYDAIVEMIAAHTEAGISEFKLQSEFNKARHNVLKAAIDNLVNNPLEVVYDYVNEFEEMDYAGYDKFLAALAQLQKDITDGTVRLRSVYNNRIDEAEALLIKLAIDPTEFNAIVATFNGLTESDYTAASYGAISALIARGQELIKNDALRSEFKEVMDELDLDDLVALELDTEAFDELVYKFENELVEDDYTPESWEALQTQIGKVQEIIDNDGLISEFEAEFAKTSLDSLVALPLDLENFNSVVNTYENELVKSDYTVESREELEELITLGNKIINKEDGYKGLRSEFKEVYDNISLDILVNEAIDSSEFDAFINAFYALDSDDYTSESWEAIESQIAVVEDIVDSLGLISQYEAEFGKLSLDNLVALPLETAEFDALVDEFNKLDKDDYTSESYDALKALIDAAQRIIDNNGLRSEFKKATENITLDSLVLIPKVIDPILSTSGNEGYAKIGDTLTVTFDTNVELNTASTIVTIHNKLAKLTKNSTTGKYEASITIGEDDEEGNVVFIIHTVGPNNLEGEEYWGVTGLTVDKTPAVTSLIPSTGGTTVGPVILTLSSDEELIITSTTDTWTKVEGKNEYTLSVEANRVVRVEYTDLAGNAGFKEYEVKNIDLVDPTATITANIETATKEDVVLTFVPSEPIKITSTTDTWEKINEYEYRLTVTSSRKVVVEFEDLVGHKGSAEFDATYIDKTPATAEVTYSNEAPTAEDVVITIRTTEHVTFDDDKLEWTEAEEVSGIYTHKYTATATESLSNTLTLADHVGNTTEISYNVSNIDKVAPTGTLVSVTPEGPTNQYKEITIRVDEEVKTTNTGTIPTVTVMTDEETGKKYTLLTAKRSTNGRYTFMFEDLAGNSGSFEYEVSGIDKEKPTAEVFNITPEGPTNDHKTITIKTSEKVTSLNTGTPVTVENFTDEDGTEYSLLTADRYSNGTFTFIFQDEAGNKGNFVIDVQGIDKEAPEGSISASTTDPTNKEITLTLTVDEAIKDLSDDEWTLVKDATLDDPSVQYQRTVSANGEFTIEYTDLAGNAGSASITISNFDDDAPIFSFEDEGTKVKEGIYNGKVTVSVSDDNAYSVYVNGELNANFGASQAYDKSGVYTIKAVDVAGNETAEVTFKIYASDPTITLEGFDTDENAIVTIKDKSKSFPTATAKDALNGDLTVTTVGIEEVKFDEIGTYTVTYSATDEAERTATRTITVRVLDASRFIAAKNRITTLQNNAEGWELLNENMYDYTSKSWSNLMMWYETVDYLIGEDEIHLNYRFDQTMLDQYIDYVVNALNALVPATINRNPYNAIIAKIDSLIESDYSAETWSRLQEKKTESETGIKLQSDANYYTKELTALVDSLEKKPVKDTTSEIFNKYLEEDYSGFKAYQTALTELSADVNEGILQSEYDRRIKEIEDTMLATRLPIDDSAFKALLKDLEDNYDEDDYTPESWTALQTKIAAVQAVIDANGLRSEYRIEFEKINLANDLVLIPKVTSATISTSGNEGYAKPGDTLTVEFETNVELDASTTVVINNKLTTFTKNAAGKYEASIVVSENDDEGNVIYTIHTVGPNGLEGEEYWGVSALIVDVTKASGTISYSTTDATSGEVTIKLTANEELSSVVDSTGAIWKKLPDDEVDLDGNTIEVHYELTVAANATGTLTITDKAGNVTTDITYNVENIDKTAATVESITYSNNGQATKDDVIITMITSERVTFEDDKLSWTEAALEGGKYQYTATAKENVSNTLTLTDHVGNVTNDVTYTVTGIDKVAAIVTVSYTDSDKALTNQDVTITLSSDKELSSISDTESMEWKFDKYDEATKKYLYKVTVSENIAGTLTVEDHVGNETVVDYEVKNIDKVLPVGTISYATGELGSEVAIEGNTATNKDVTIKLKSTKKLVEILDTKNMNWMENVQVEVDAFGEDPDIYYYRVTVSENIAGTLTIKDEAGNVVEGIEYNVSGIDKVAPVATLAPNTTDMTNQDVKLTLNVTGDEEVTIVEANVDYELVDGKYVFTVTENKEVIVTIADAVGNEAVVTYNVENIDKVAPIITAKIKETDKPVSSGSYYKGTVIVTVDEGILYDNNKEIENGAELTADGLHRIFARDAAGNETAIKYIGIDNTAPVVEGVIEDGIYDENGVTITATDITAMTATIDGEEYTLGENYAVDGHHTLVVTDKVGNATTVEFDIITEAPNIDIVGEKTNGIYTGTVTVNVTGAHIDTIKNGDEVITNGTSIALDGTYTITATDKAGHSATVTFTIDTIDPEIGGFEDGKTYSTSITVTISDTNLVSATLADGSTVVDGQTFTENGTYTITAVDAAGHTVTKSFTIDKQPPVVTGIEDGGVYTSDVTVVFDKGTATVNSETIENGATLSDGKYELVVTSSAGLETKMSFIVDTKAPVINGFDDDAHYNTDITVNVVDDNIVYIKKNGETIENGTTFSQDGVYEITTKDIAGREVSKTFTIDKTAPTITLSGTGKNGIYSTDVTIAVNDANISTIKDALGNVVAADATFTENGTYTITATDIAGNETEVTFTIDKQAPVVTGVENGQVYGEVKTISFDKGTATLNGESFENNTTVSDGRYELIVTGDNGLTTTVNFTIDTIAPVISSVEDGKVYGSNVTLEFSDATTNTRARLGLRDVESGHVVTEDGTYTLTVVDEAGNTSTVTFTVDKTAPVLEVIDNDGVKHTEDFEVTVEANKMAPFRNFEYTASDREGVTVDVGIDGFVKLAELGNYTLTYTATDDAGNEKVINVTVRVKDTEAPVISMAGAEVIEVKYGSSYSDTYGATATDAFEGELEVKTTGNVDIYNLGDYEIVYTAKDSSGNTATQKRTVRVVSTTATQLFKDANACTDGTDCYSTQAKNNYVWYSGHLWRVVKVNADNTLRLVTDDAVSGFSFDDNSSVFVGSNAEKWLNNVFYPSLNNASSIVATGDFCNEKLTSRTKVRYTCNPNSVVKSKVGLLTIDDYNILGGQNGFLNNGDHFFTMTPSSEDTTWVVKFDGSKEIGYYVNEPYAMRPVININSVDVVSGKGTATEPFRIASDNSGVSGANLSTRTSGEYVNFGGKTWRIVSSSTEGTKLITDNYLTTNDGYVKVSYGTVGTFNTSTGIGQYLNSTVYDGFTAKEKSVIKLSRWYNNKYAIGQNPMDTTLINGNSYTDAYVGLIRVGELMSGSTSTNRVDRFTYWTLNSANQNTWFISWGGTSEYSSPADARGVRPVITLDNSVKIKSGDGTAANPYELEY